MKQYGLIGFPLLHSFSPDYFAKLFAREKRKDCRYDAYEISSISMLLNLIRKKKLLGMNVTIPYKQTVISLLDYLHPAALRIGAVNCVKIDRRHNRLHMIGFNTDYLGFRQTFIPCLTSAHTKALVLGSGGSSLAVRYVLKKENIPYLLVSRLASANTISYNDLTPEMVNMHTVIINTTPVGMFPETNFSPSIPYEGISSNHLLYDLIYNPAETIFLQEGRRRGAKIINGYEMLCSQAEESWKIWQSDSVFWE